MDEMKSLSDAFPRYNPDPDGDIQSDITNRAASTSIQLSLHMLTIASPVFKRILTSEFKEGQVPQYGPRIISPKEDSPDAMTLICHTMYLTEIHVTFGFPGQVICVCIVRACSVRDLLLSPVDKTLINQFPSTVHHALTSP